MPGAALTGSGPGRHLRSRRDERAKEDALERLADVVRESGLVDAHASAVVMVSGGADSACAAAGPRRGPSAPRTSHALHVNYRLRPGADEGERAARAICGALRIDLHVERPNLGRGNLQAMAREARYDAAERLRSRTSSNWIATGHTRTDLAETVLYRLAASPGTRPLLGLRARNGRVIRPLLGLGRAEVRDLATAAALPFADDETNADRTFARNRIRAEVLPVLGEISRSFERKPRRDPRGAGRGSRAPRPGRLEALAGAGAGAGAVAVEAGELQGLEPALRRLALRALAERAAGRPVAVGRARDR